MAIAALIISVLALGVAGLSAWYARSQARAAIEATGIERDRRHDERSPSFTAEIEDVNNDGGFYRLWVTVTTQEPLDEVSVELPPKCGFHFTTGIYGVMDGRRAASYEGEIEPGGRACWRVELIADDYKEREMVLVRSRRAAAEWSRQVSVDVPYEIGMSVY